VKGPVVRVGDRNSGSGLGYLRIWARRRAVKGVGRRQQTELQTAELET